MAQRTGLTVDHDRWVRDRRLRRRPAPRAIAPRPTTRSPSGRSSENSSAQLRSPLILKHDPLDDLWPYLRVRVPPDEYAKVLQANAGLAWILDDVKFFRSKCLAD